ncbi:MAG TPA: PilZ domain-containing protein [Syntrophales bacterium]|nr:PilZ domain-containing protein [Syntrophales bacterium]
MKEKRRYKRFFIEGMDVQCRMFYASEVKILNISFGGVALSLNKRLNMGDKYTLKIESESNTISLNGVVVWEKMTGLAKEVKGKKFPIYEVGMRFDEVLTGEEADLLNFIRENICDKAIKTRVQGLRVKIIQPEKTVLLDDRESDYVKMISLGGMLIESKEELEIAGRFPMEMSFLSDIKPIKFLGRTAYCTEILGKMPKRYDTVIEFIEMNEKDRARLKEFLEILQAI